MVEFLSKISFEGWLLGVFVLALIAKLIGVIIGDIRRFRSDPDDWGDDGREEESSEEEALHQVAFWECSSCETQFRVSDGAVPKVCPSCGEQLIPVSADMGPDVAAYNCLHCGPYFLLDGDDSDVCPVCGSKDVREIGLAIRRPERWCCTGCEQEFTTPSTPKLCPHCGEKFVRTDGKVDDGCSAVTCPACGKETEMMDGEEMRWCPYCETMIRLN